MLRISLIVVFLAFATHTAAVEVVIDYSQDSSGFFSTATANGLAARDTLDFAAALYSELLSDTLTGSIPPPAPYVATAPDSPDLTTTFGWQAVYSNPNGGADLAFNNPLFAADELRVYVGAQDLGAGSLAEGGPATSAPVVLSGGQVYTTQQQTELIAIVTNYGAQLEQRGEPTGEFATWGGTVSFNSQATWNFDRNAQATLSQNDLLTIALHELGHVFGFGIADEFFALQSGSSFTGATATAVNGGVAPPLSPDSIHWFDGTQSKIFGASRPQQTLFDPTITTGQRERLTELDAAALSDLGWEITLPGDHNGDGVVNTADYVTWRYSLSSPNEVGNYDVWKSFFGATSAETFLGSPSTLVSVPEPAGALLIAYIMFATLCCCVRQINSGA